MSYTALDYLRDMRRPPDRDQIDEWIERGLCVMRKADVEALVQVAKDEGLDPENEDQWNDEPEDNSVLLALSNWAKEHRDWEP